MRLARLRELRTRALSSDATLVKLSDVGCDAYRGRYPWGDDPGRYLAVHRASHGAPLIAQLDFTAWSWLVDPRAEDRAGIALFDTDALGDWAGLPLGVALPGSSVAQR